MRKTLYTLFAVLGLCLFASCSDDKENDSPLAQQLEGEWHLVSWVGSASVDFDTYISFTAGGQFEIYQRIENVGYEKYTGTYQLNDNIFSGRYSNNTPLKSSSYEISFDEAGNTLTMTSEPSLGEVSVYTRTAIPGSIKGGAVVVKSSRSAGRLPL